MVMVSGVGRFHCQLAGGALQARAPRLCTAHGMDFICDTCDNTLTRRACAAAQHDLAA